jgi:TRAP-type C4-dicarboxylate transport system permease small subunit
MRTGLRRSEPPAAPDRRAPAGGPSGSAPRRALDLLYRATGGLAGVFLAGTLLVILVGIVSRFLGLYVRGTDDYAGYSMAASGFLALAYTFKHGEHIRVSLLLERLAGRPRRSAEILALAVAAIAAGVLAWYSVRLSWNSLQFNEISQGVDATPLWIPQLAMGAGAVVLFVAVLDDLVTTLAGRSPTRLQRLAVEPSRVE